jgi:hypothetical protein
MGKDATIKEIKKEKEDMQKNSLAEMKRLQSETEFERSLKVKQEKLNQELERVCNKLKHKALAYVVQRARERRKTEEAKAEAEKLAEDVEKGEIVINDLQQKQEQS